MEEKSIIIIGAGLAGLSAGCYSQMNGYKTRIFEINNKPGGLCTSWKRKGYTFDGCIHFLIGSRTGLFYKYYQELGAVQNRGIVNLEEFRRFEDSKGKTLKILTDLDQQEQHMKELAPADAALIEEFCNAARIFAQYEVENEKAIELMGLMDRLKNLKKLRVIKAWRKYSKITIQNFMSRFTDPFLRKTYHLAFGFPHAFPMTLLLLTMGELHRKNAGYPLGGSLEFARAIECRYLGLGGKVEYESRVAKILVEDDRAVGVRLIDDTEHKADMVISAADGRTTIFDMLEGKYINEKIRNYYDSWPVCPPYIQISLGVNRDLSDIPHSFSIPFDVPINSEEKTYTLADFRHYCYDSTMAPPGKSVITVSFMSVNYDYWKKLHKEPERYKAAKQDLADRVIDKLEKRFPGLKDEVEVVDVTTPVTYKRYTRNWQGSFMGWDTTIQNISESMSRMLPGLGNFYMAGHWVFNGGGVPGAVKSGRHLIQIICKQDKRPFTTTVL